MFMNRVEMPVVLKRTKILLDSLPVLHAKRAKVENDYKIKLSGFYGEQNTAYYLGFLQRDYYHIYHNLRFPTFDGGYFQMDFVICSPHFITIIEVKNYIGEIIFDTTFNQLIRRSKGKEERFGSPLDQVLRQRFHLNKFLENNHFYGIPIEHLVVFSHTNCILKTDNKDHPLTERVTLAEDLPNRIEKLRAKYSKQVLDSNALNRLSKILFKKNTPDDPNLLKEYNISPSELLKGVPCFKCGHLPMVYSYGKWHCPICGATSFTAHYQKLYQYSMLVNNEISIRDGCQLLLIDREKGLWRLFKKMGLDKIGEGKSSTYNLKSGVLKNYKSK